MLQKTSYETIKKEVEKRGYILISKEYINERSKLTVMDNEGYLLMMTWGNFNKGHDPQRFRKENIWTIKNIKHWIKKNNKPFNLLSEEYINNGTPLIWFCNVCKEKFNSTWSSINGGCGCSYCSGRNIGLSNCLANKRPDIAKQWHPTKNKNLTPFDVTCGSGRDIFWMCENNHEWKTTIAHRIEGTRCPFCINKLPTKEYNLSLNKMLIEEWDYSRNEKLPESYMPLSHTKVYWICKKCNHNWKTSISHRSNGKGCPKCKASHLEKEISLFLEKNNIRYIPQHKFEDCKNIFPLPFDFYLIDYKACIEAQGHHHYFPVDFNGFGQEYANKQFEKTKHNDNIKKEYCKKIENNLKLIEIKYTEFENIEQILKKELHID